MISRHRRAATAAGLVASALLVFVLVWFQPQKLFIDETVSETLPSSSPQASGSLANEPRRGPRTLASGDFRSLEHDTTGTASLVRLEDGRVVLRFYDLETSNGPDLRVYLSERPPTLGWRDYGEEFIELGKLKGNRGDQNYAVPDGTDLSRYESAVIWCVRFAVGFGVAGLS